MENWSPDKAIAILVKNKVKGFFCKECRGELTPYLFRSFICKDCGQLYQWKVEGKSSEL